MENREAVNLEIELECHKNKSKLRETELLEELNNKQKEISKLEKSVSALSADSFRNSKEFLFQKSLDEGGSKSATDQGKICIKCEDVQRLLEENKKNISDFEKLTLEYEKLKLSYTESETENQRNKLKIVELEQLQEKDKAECEKLLLDVQQLKEKLEYVQKEYEQLFIQKASKEEECVTLNKQLRCAAEEMMVLEEKFTKLELSWLGQQKTISDIETKYASIQAKYEELQHQYEEVEASKGHSLTEYERLEKENFDLQKEIEDLKAKVHDAQQSLLESNAKYEQTAKETRTAKEEYSTKASQVQLENERLTKQLFEIEKRFVDLQKEYDDLSNQLMDNLQDSELLKDENTKLNEKLKDSAKRSEKEVTKAQSEILELKLQLENMLASERKCVLRTPSPYSYSSTRSSGISTEDDDHIDTSQSQELLTKFREFAESLTIIQLEHTSGKIKIFKSISGNSTSSSYKMYLSNILDIEKTQRNFELEEKNVLLQGSFKQHNFYIVDLKDKVDDFCELNLNDIDIDGCSNVGEYIQKLKQDIIQQKDINEQERLSNKSILENTERALSEMKEQIEQLSSELLEKSVFVENCACKTYKQQIENLTKENADMTTLCEELQGKVNSRTVNGSFNTLMNNATQEAAIDNKMKDQQSLETYDIQTKFLEEITQRCIDLETELETAREQIANQEIEFKAENHQLKLENLQRLELSANEYRDNMKKYNKEWQDRKEKYEQTIKDLQTEINALKETAINTHSLSCAEVKEETETICDSQENREINPFSVEHSNVEEEKLNLQQQITAVEVTLEQLREENRAKDMELSVLNAELISLKELLVNSKDLHVTLSREWSLKSKLGDMEDDLNCSPELREENRKLSNKIDEINEKYWDLQDKLALAESQIQEFSREDGRREELIRNLQTKNLLTATLEKERDNLANDFEDLKLEYKHSQDKLHKAQEQLQEFGNEDSGREEFIKALQTKVLSMTTVQEENKTLVFESMRLRETLNSLQKREAERDKETCEEIESLKQNIGTLTENVSQLENQNTDLEEKLKRVKSECNLLQTDKVLHDSQLNELKEENKLLCERCSALQEQTSNLVDQLKCLKQSEKSEELLKQTAKEKHELEQNLRLTTEQLDTAKKQLEEKQNQILHVIQIQQDLQSQNECLLKTVEEQRTQLLEKDREQQKLEDHQNKLVQQLENEKYDSEQNSKKIEQEQNILQIVLKEKEHALNRLENDCQNAQQQNIALQNELKNLMETQKEKSNDNSRLQAELEETKESLVKIQGEKQNLAEKLVHYQKLQEDKNKLEASLNVLKKAQTGALSNLQEEKAELYKTIQQLEQRNQEFKEKEDTLKEKLESLTQQLHEMRLKVDSHENLLLEHTELESMLSATSIENEKLQQTVLQFTSERENYVSKIENLSSEISKLNIKCHNQTEENQMLQKKLSRLEENLESEKSLQKDYHELKSSLEELKLKCDSLQATNAQLESLNEQMKEQLNSAMKKVGELNSIQEELKALQNQHDELQNRLKETIEESGRCSQALDDDVKRHKQLLQRQLENYNSLKVEMETKERCLTEENRNLSYKIDSLQKQKLDLEDKLREIKVRNIETDLQRQVIDVTTNSSTDSTTSFSPKGRRSIDHITDRVSGNNSLEEKIIQQKNSTTVERKNRRLSTHDERRRQSYWGVAHDKETMTDPLELDLKLKECERNLFIKNSHVTALRMELKNHPLIDENASLKKRLQEEQEKHRNEIKRYKNKLREQSAKAEKAMAAAAHVTAKSAHEALAAEQKITVVPILPKVLADVEVQTCDELSGAIHKLQSKYNDLKNICRGRYNTIKELEEKVAQKENSHSNFQSSHEPIPLKLLNNQCDSLKKELETLKIKYECAKKVLHYRREEIIKLRSQLGLGHIE